MRRSRSWPGTARVCRVGALGLLTVLTFLSAAPAHARGTLRFTATIDGRNLARVDTNRPLKLRGDRPVSVAVAVTNTGTADATVRSVRLESRVIGLTFFAYETRVDVTVPPGATLERRFPVELLDLSQQATGLLPARVTLLDDRRHEVAVQRFAADVDGSLWSVYGGFAILVIAITAVLVAAAVVRLLARNLSTNRWKRAVRFGTAGIGVGLSLTFSLSALRLLLPDASRWLPLVLASGGILFAIGYLTPSPDLDEYEPELEQALVGSER